MGLGRALSTLLWTFIVKTQCVPRKFNLFIGVIIIFFNAHRYAKYVVSPLKSKQIWSAWIVTNGFFFWRNAKITRDLNWSCVMPEIEDESLFISQTTRNLKTVTTTAKINHEPNLPFREQKPTTILFRGDDTFWFTRKTSRDYGAEEPFALATKVSPPITINPIRKWKKKDKNHSFLGVTQATFHSLIHLFRLLVRVSFSTNWVDSSAI